MDRDGTVCEEVGYVNHVDRLRLIEGSAEAIQKANRAGFQTVLVTNQAGVARGYMSEELVGETHDRLRDLLADHDARLDGIYYCPHHPDVGPSRYHKACDCRKPEPGMLLRARDEMGIDLGGSYVIGDSIKDVQTAKRVGASGILVLTGYGRGQLEYQSAAWPVRPDHVAENLLEAVNWILERGDGLSEGPANPGRSS